MQDGFDNLYTHFPFDKHTVGSVVSTITPFLSPHNFEETFDAPPGGWPWQQYASCDPTHVLYGSTCRASCDSSNFVIQRLAEVPSAGAGLANTGKINEELLLQSGGEWRVEKSISLIRKSSVGGTADCRIAVPIQREWAQTFTKSFVIYMLVTLCGLCSSVLGVSPPPVLGARMAVNITCMLSKRSGSLNQRCAYERALALAIQPAHVGATR